MRRARVLPLLAWWLLMACAKQPAQPPARPKSRPAEARPEQVRLPRTVVTPTDASSIVDLYARAKRRLEAGQAKEAAEAFDRVFVLDPDGDLAQEALLEASAAWEVAGDRPAAVGRLQQLARRFPTHPLARVALVRSVRLLAFLERWDACGHAAELLLTRYSDLGSLESVVAHGGRALSLLAAGDVDAASYHVEKGRSVVEKHRLDAAGRLPRDLAQLYFALGEVRRIRAEAIRLVPLPADFAGEFERRCQLLLDAQSAYSDTMRAYDAHWSAMAGYRVGELYQKLHDELMRVPPPESADTVRRKQLFEGAMRLRYSVLLTKALTMMEHTLSMAERTGERSAWVLRAEAAKLEIERAIREEEASLDRLGYTRAELQAGLDQLARKAKKGGK